MRNTGTGHNRLFAITPQGSFSEDRMCPSVAAAHLLMPGYWCSVLPAVITPISCWGGMCGPQLPSVCCLGSRQLASWWLQDGRTCSRHPQDQPTPCKQLEALQPTKALEIAIWIKLDQTGSFLFDLFHTYSCGISSWSNSFFILKS